MNEDGEEKNEEEEEPCVGSMSHIEEEKGMREEACLYKVKEDGIVLFKIFWAVNANLGKVLMGCAYLPFVHSTYELKLSIFQSKYF